MSRLTTLNQVRAKVDRSKETYWALSFGVCLGFSSDKIFYIALASKYAQMTENTELPL